MNSNKLSISSWIFAVISVVLSIFLAINCIINFYAIKIQGQIPKKIDLSFFTISSYAWANLIFGLLFLLGIYITYKGIREVKSFYIFASLIYTFALLSLFISFLA